MEHHLAAEKQLFEVYGKHLPKYMPEKHADTTLTLIKLKSANRLALIPPEKIQQLLDKSTYTSIEEIPTAIPDEMQALRRQLNLRNSSKHLTEVNTWAQNFIAEHGGIQGTKDLFRNAFMELQPQFLPVGYLDS